MVSDMTEEKEKMQDEEEKETGAPAGETGMVGLVNFEIKPCVAAVPQWLENQACYQDLLIWTLELYHCIGSSKSYGVPADMYLIKRDMYACMCMHVWGRGWWEGNLPLTIFLLPTLATRLLDIPN